MPDQKPITPARRRGMMRAFLASTLLMGFMAVNTAFVWAYLVLDKPLETVGTAVIMALINFTGLGLGFYLGDSQSKTTNKGGEPNA